MTNRKYAVVFSGPNGYAQTVNFFPSRLVADRLAEKIASEHPDRHVWVDPVVWVEDRQKYVICQ